MSTLSLIYEKFPVDSPIRTLLTGPKENKWIKILKAQETGKVLVGQLLHAIYQVPGWENNKLLEKLHKKAIKKFGNKEASKLASAAGRALQKEQLKKETELKAKATAETKPETKPDSKAATKVEAKAEVAPAKPVIPPSRLENLGATCWMNTLLQYLRTTKTHESILTGAIHDSRSDAHLANLTSLQEQLVDIVGKLRDPAVQSIPKELLQRLANALHACGFIDNPTTQHDATEVLTRLSNYFGRAPDSVQIDQVKQFTDGMQEVQKNHEMSVYFPLWITEKNASIKTLLDNYFGKKKEPCARLIVTYKDGATERLDGSEARLAVIKDLPKTASEDDILKAQIATIKSARGDVDVKVVPLEFLQKRVASLPNMIQVRLNRRDENMPQIEESINFGRLHTVPVDAMYDLTSVMCRSGAHTNGSGGHYWYYQKEGDRWVRYNDSSMDYRTAEEAHNDFNANAYGLFYTKA